MKTYIFFRENGFYPIEAPDDATAIHMGWLNPGTLKITTLGNVLIWTPPFEIYFREEGAEDGELSKVKEHAKGGFIVEGPVYSGLFTYDDAVERGLISPSPLYKKP